MVKHLIYYMSLLAAVLLSGCASDEMTDIEQPLPEGMGRLRVTLCAPENATTTRGVNVVPWEDPDHAWEQLKTFRILICTESATAGKYDVVDVISGTGSELTEVAHTDKGNVGTSNSLSSTHKSGTFTSNPLEPGAYYIFAVGNFTNAEYADKFAIGKTIDPEETVKYANGYSETDIRMTGRIASSVTVTAGVENPCTISIWRVLAKMQFYFTNQSDTKIRIKSVEVEPLNNIASGDDAGKGLIYLCSKDNLESEKNLKPNTNTAGASKIDKGVTATWALHDNETITTPLNGIISETSLLTSAQLALGSKLTATGSVTAEDEAKTKLQKFKTTENIENKDEASVITLTVTPKSGLSFKPTDLSFTASRVGTDGGKIAVVAGSTTLAENQQPARYNGKGGLHEPPFITKYNYKLTSAATTAPFVIKIYLYGLNQKEIAFSDVVITGIATQDISVAPAATDATDGVTLPSGAMNGVRAFEYLPSLPLELAAGATTHDPFFFYVNETDKSFTTINNQLSLRFKIQRWNATTNSWYDDEIRYGVTTHHSASDDANDPYGTDKGGFNVIRRNDWIHIPVVLTDWQFRVEPLAFVPIAGYPATTVSSDGLTATFSTGGMIALQPFIKKYSEETWRSFDIHDPEISDISISWKSQTGSESLVTTPFIYDPVTKSIIGELNNNLGAGTYKTSITVNATLESFPYSFTFNVWLKKTE